MTYKMIFYENYLSVLFLKSTVIFCKLSFQLTVIQVLLSDIIASDLKLPLKISVAKLYFIWEESWPCSMASLYI